MTLLAQLKGMGLGSTLGASDQLLPHSRVRAARTQIGPGDWLQEGDPCIGRQGPSSPPETCGWCPGCGGYGNYMLSPAALSLSWGFFSARPML